MKTKTFFVLFCVVKIMQPADDIRKHTNTIKERFASEFPDENTDVVILKSELDLSFDLIFMYTRGEVYDLKNIQEKIVYNVLTGELMNEDTRTYFKVKHLQYNLSAEI